MQLLNNTALNEFLRLVAMHLYIWPCLGQFSLACDAVHSLLIVLEHLHTKLSRCNAVPSLQHTAFYISLLSCYFNLAKATEGKLPKRLFACRAVKKICISCHWFPFPLFLTGVCIPRWLSQCFDYSHGPQSIQWDGFTSALVKWNTFTGDGSQTESNHYFKKDTHFDWCKRVWGSQRGRTNNS